jgi:microcystin-dependent protein
MSPGGASRRESREEKMGDGIMGQPFVGEIRIFAGTYVPLDWAFCDGTHLQINSNPILFQLIGTTYGGDGVSTFALPDLRGRVPVHQGAGGTIGQVAGQETVTLTSAQLPSHSHVLQSSITASSISPNNNLPASTVSPAGTSDIYGPAGAKPTSLSPASLLQDGGSQPHNNIQPYLTINFIIALNGVFPSQ